MLTVKDFSREELPKAIAKYIIMKNRQDSYSLLDIAYEIDSGLWLDVYNDALAEEAKLI